MPLDADPCLLKNTEIYLSEKYDTYSQSGIYAIKQEYSNNTLLDEDVVEIDYKDEGVYRLRLDDKILDTSDRVDIRIASSEECNLSETKQIEIDSECANQEIYLTWLNTLGAWEYWKFTAQKDYGVNIGNTTEITRDITADWDSYFINGETQRDMIEINARNEYNVISQYMTEEQP